jgi:DNA invertase Pin-like site-specific DNA recombinase
MLKNRVDLRKDLLVVLYLRMSSDRQNPRSPEQQRDTIEATMRRLGLPWRIVAVYTDSGVSGKLVRRREEFQRMLRDIRSGAVASDAILVDTFERFGRAEELDGLRRELFLHHGVVLLTADTSFADPTSSTGRVMSAFESLRATEDNRVKAHYVLRGKRDAAKLGHWPGGPAPFGLRLRSVLVERAGRQELDHCVLEWDPESAWIIQLIFRVAAERGWGSARIAKMLNADPAVPEKFKPFFAPTVNYWLSREIYTGVLVWEQYATDFIEDRRVRQRNDTGDVIRVEGFCDPLVERAIWERVQELRRARAQRITAVRAARKRAGVKSIVAVAPGLALKYPLSGLVRCGHCERVMVPSGTAAYTNKAGEQTRYTAYACPGYPSGACPNGRRIPEAWLRDTVFGLMARRLFGESS